jgi:signal transduction histidine kinase
MTERANVLVVDDEMGPRESMRMILKPLHNVFTAEDGVSALKTIQQEPIDLVTLDLRMPGIDGIEVLKQIKKHNPNIEVIVVTGYGSLKTATEAMKYGVKGYVTKPYNLQEINTLVEKAIEQRRFNLKLRNFFKETVLSGTGNGYENATAEPLPINGNNLEDSKTRSNLLDVTESKFRQMKETQEDTSKENAVLEEKLIHSERLAMVGLLTAGYAHELNNSLTTMLGNAQLVQNAIQAKHPELKDLLDRVETISHQIDRASEISRSLLTISRKNDSQREPTDVSKLLEQLMTYTEYRIRKEELTVVRDCDPSLPLMFVNPHRIEQVFLNLMINAFHAMNRGGVLKITARRVTRDAGDMVQVEFADNGHGIPAENIKEIFNPFFSTREKDGGTGLGLYVSKKIVEQHQGTIDVVSTLNKGTTFILEFPAIKN